MNSKPIQIKKEGPSDYEKLRDEALSMVQKLSGHIWTDYNIHDPGVTMLEQVCFAMTDLRYKTGFPIEEILAGPTGHIDPKAHAFYNKGEVLSSGPVTTADFCKLLLGQVVGVEQVWIEPVVAKSGSTICKGIFNVLVQPDENITTTGQYDQLKEDVKGCLMRYRSLGENFEDITILRPLNIAIKAAILVDGKQQVKETLAYICNTIEQTIHPPVRFLSEAELLAMGKTTEEIYSGPLLSGGFIPDEDLKPLRIQVDPAELIKAISSLDGVLQVKYLSLSLDGKNFSNKQVRIPSGYFASVDISNSMNDISIVSDQYEHHSQDALFWNVFERIKEIRKRHYTGQQVAMIDTTLQSAYRDLGKYYSIQHFFPAIYGIGREGISKDETNARKAQAKQLKGYLLFFEQVLANYAAQLGNISQFFSPAEKPTYFSQSLDDVPDIAQLLDPGYLDALPQAGNSDERKEAVLDHLIARFNLPLLPYPITLFQRLYGGITTLEWKAGLLKKLPDLMYARMQAEAGGYQEALRQLLYFHQEQDERLTAVFEKSHLSITNDHPSEEFTVYVSDETIHVVSEIPPDEEGYYFGHQPLHLLRYGIDPVHYKIVENHDHYLVLYKSPGQHTWQAVARHTTRQAALDAQIAMIRHLKNISIQSEGFYVVEHTLLKPLFTDPVYGFRVKNSKGEVLKEAQHLTFADREKALEHVSGHIEFFVMATPWHVLPESFFKFNITIVLSAWPARCQYEEFRRFTESLFRDLTPTQYRLKFRWLGVNDMRKFETAYFDQDNKDKLLDFLT
ncbi:hypothetical protein SIO70_21245 [Chitinophaga sancti]|uniref:hypothetical protein n=1 Tax=Chitinophaga sancti TaxID=1004 RepID=UPI002A753833|nr:hypothetical protein [Chitinophaga sancti]WPQ60886.1 hypothetical protein SIO70_21245 [Chitinophaga sancti]